MLLGTVDMAPVTDSFVSGLGGVLVALLVLFSVLVGIGIVRRVLGV